MQHHPYSGPVFAGGLDAGAERQRPRRDGQGRAARRGQGPQRLEEADQVVGRPQDGRHGLQPRRPLGLHQSDLARAAGFARMRACVS